MRIKMLKFNSDRAPIYQVKTKIIDVGGKTIVRKSASTKAAEKHILDIYQNHAILKKKYIHIEACPVELVDGELEFEFIDGELLSDKYRAAIASNNKDLFLTLLDLHKKIIIDSPNNNIIFNVTPEFEKIFGNGIAYEGQHGLSFVNFEATSQNIMFRNNTDTPIFIDYEWVFQFPMPLELVLYHCIVRINVFCLTGVDEFISMDEVIKYLDIKTDISVLNETWKRFISMVNGSDEKSLASVKTDRYLKPVVDVSCIVEENEKMRGTIEYNQILEKNIKMQQDYIDGLNHGILNQNKYVTGMEENLENQQDYITKLEENQKWQQDYIEVLDKNISIQQEYITQQEKYKQELSRDCEVLKKDNKCNKSKLDEMKILVEKQQIKLLEQAEFIAKVKSSIYGYFFLRK